VVIGHGERLKTRKRNLERVGVDAPLVTNEWQTKLEMKASKLCRTETRRFHFSRPWLGKSNATTHSSKGKRALAQVALTCSIVLSGEAALRPNIFLFDDQGAFYHGWPNCVDFYLRQRYGTCERIAFSTGFPPTSKTFQPGADYTNVSKDEYDEVCAVVARRPIRNGQILGEFAGALVVALGNLHTCFRILRV
jgi:hypothetical protein